MTTRLVQPIGWMCIPHSSLWPPQRPERSLDGSSGSDVDHLGVTPVANPVLAVKPTPGCGKAPTQSTGQFVRHTITTSGTKAPNATGVPGPWTYEREYFVWLPPNYNANKAYPLVFEMPGCGGNGTNVYTLDNGSGAGAGGNVISVGLTPPPNAIKHVTNPSQGRGPSLMANR